ncbi:MAG: restriction endonuclease subunit S [Actinobacteria bacterium]|nr:restriction endonuclease subunit S [Actinomycetota bacterium]
MTAIGEVVRKISSWNPSRHTSADPFLYVDLSSVDRHAKRITGARPTSPADAPSRARQLLEQGDVVVSTVRPNLNAVAYVTHEFHGATASTGFTVLRPTDRIDGRYLFHWVQSPVFIQDMVAKATGASYPAVSDRVVKESPLPLPPIEEQRRIAAILDDIDRVTSLASEVIETLQDVPGVLLQRTVSRPDVEWLPLEEVTAQVIDCPHSTPKWTESGVRCLRTSNLTRGGWDWTDSRFVSEADHLARSRRGELAEGDIVLSREGTVGVAAIVPSDLRASMGQRLVQVKPSRRLSGSLLMHYLLFALHPARISGLMVGSTSRHLNVKDLRSLRVPVPALKAQEAFEAAVHTIDNELVTARRRLDEAVGLAKSIQARAFSGRL